MTFHRLSLSAPARKRVRTVTLSAAVIAGVAMPTLAQAATIGSTHTPTQQTAQAASGTTATATNVSDSTPTSSDTTRYTVVAGDTLFGIAKSKLGNGDDYHKLWNLNKDRTESDGAKFTNEDLIQIGWTILVPSGSASSTSSDSATTATTSSSAGSDQSSTGSSASSNSSAKASSSTSSSSSTDSTTTYADNLDGWINQAISILNAHGYSVSYNAIYQTAMNESSGNPSAENGWDSNAAAGTPSIGLMQMIQPTFDAYALSGYNDIYNPVDNIISAVIYAQATYGGLDNVVAARCGGSCWYGY
ncbi:LysM peptidoglycan-binding domain-containing protein [Actinospica robiniae]|uniref:LysM peptidoglycan-binding domain-containing protein n=1 Tax=Actinospica robiniae TaxID=304901 RepID=UPI00042A6F6E|nr:transglycosylase SLT domain-containing protein [Actinospica robiniae]